MPDERASPPANAISQIIAAQDHWYVHFSGLDQDHNDHTIIGWAVQNDNATVVPLITSPTNQKDIVQAQTVSPDYTIYNPYSQCQNCVRP